MTWQESKGLRGDRKDGIGAGHNAARRDFCDDRRVRPTVLIVDDHDGFRESARALLEAEGFTVVGDAADGAAAVAAAARLRPDVVLLDVQLPNVDGFAVAGRLAGGPDPPRVVLISSREAALTGRAWAILRTQRGHRRWCVLSLGGVAAGKEHEWEESVNKAGLGGAGMQRRGDRAAEQQGNPAGSAALLGVRHHARVWQGMAHLRLRERGACLALPGRVVGRCGQTASAHRAEGGPAAAVVGARAGATGRAAPAR